MILNSQSQLQSDLQFVLIDIDDKSSTKLIESVDQNLVFIDAVSKQTNWIKSSLDQLGLAPGCYLISDLRNQTDINVTNLINGFSPIRQYGYQVGIIADINQLSDLDDLNSNQVYLINSGKDNQMQDALLRNDEITDYSGKLSKGMSVGWQRDYTNVDVSNDHVGYVGMGQDTLLKGGRGFGYSTNGKDFNTVISPKGIVFRRPDAERMWRLLRPKEIEDINNTVGDKVQQGIDSATAEIPNIESTANEAVKRADSAIAASKVNSDAQIAMSSAITAAQDGVNSATAAIQQTAANAASDAAKIRADVAQVQNEVDTAKAANSASVEALKSDVSAAKQDLSDVHDSLTKAQSAIEQNQKLINDSVAKITSDVSATKQDLATVHDSLTKARAAAEQNQKAIDKSIAQINDSVDATNQSLAGVRKDLTKAQSDITANQKAVNDNVAQINSNIEQDRKDIASAQQANADTAKQLDTYSKQATEQGKTIKTIQDKQDGFTATLADVQGNVSQVSDKVDGLSASLKDTQGNVASIKAQADQLSATLTDHSKSIATLTASAKELSSTLEDANGRLSKVEQTAQTNSSTLSDVQGDLSQVKQNATKLVSTLKDAQGNISTLQQKADSVSAQLASAQGDIATLQTGVAGVKATLASHDKSIHTLQADSKSLKDSMVNAQGDISTLRKTATDVTSELEDHTGRLSKVEQSAATLTNEFADQQGHLNRVEQTAQGTEQTVANQQGQINTIKTDASGIHETLTGQGNQIASINVTLSGLNSKYEGVSGDLGKLSDKVTTNSTQITQNKKEIDLKADQSTVNNLTGEVSQNKAQLKVQAGQISSKVSSTDFKTLNDKVGNLQAGSRNLIADGDASAYGATVWENTTFRTHPFYYNSTKNMFVIDTTSKTEVTAGCPNRFPVKAGHQYTLYFNGFMSTNVSSYDVWLLGKKADNQGGWTDSYQIITGERLSPINNCIVTRTFTVPSSWDNYVAYVRFDNNGSTDGTSAEFFFNEVSLKEGNINTGYSPALEDSITLIKKNSTAIDQTNQKISLKADQTEVDKVKQTASQNSSRLNVMAGEISSKVTSTDVNNIVDGKGYVTTSTVQSLITQKAGTINESITNLDSKYNTTVTQVQSLTASIDGLQSTVANKADKSQITQLSNTIQSKVSAADFNSKITQLSNDINLRVTKGDLLGQINIQAGNTLIQSGKICLDANTIVFGENSKAIIPNAAIGNIDASKITTGSISVPMSDANGKATVNVEDGKVIITGIGPGVDQVHSSLTPFDPDYIGQSDITIDHEGLSFDATIDIWNGHPGTNKALGVFRPTSLDTVDTAGISYIVKNFPSEDGPKNAGDYFAIDRQGLGEYQYIHGVVYKASEDHGSVHLGTHFYDPVYIHPYGAETGIRSTWCSWSSMGNRKFPALVNSDHGWSGIAFPMEGSAFIFNNNGYVARPNQKIDNYNDYGEGNKGWYDPTDSNQAGQTIDYSKWA